MGIDHRNQRYCDNCGALIDKAVRVHQGADYCRTCYGQNFVACQCGRCGGPLRRHRLAPIGGACGPCERAERVCLRCGRLTPKAARLVNGQAVCGGCVSHFNEEEKCSICGRLSRRMFSSLLLGKDKPRGGDVVDECHDTGLAAGGKPICQPCRNKDTHATCSVCRKHRRVSARREGRPLCAACAAPVPLTHPCPSCGTEVPGDGHGRCSPCMQLDLALKRAKVLRAGLERDWCLELWDAFVERMTTPPAPIAKASARLGASMAYFQQIDAAFERRDALNAESLHAAIASPTHRKHLLAYRFMLEHIGAGEAAQATAAEQARDKSNESRRLTEVLARAKGRPYEEVLQAYVAALQGANVSAKTVRLYAGVAQSFCERSGVTSLQAWKTQAVVRFLSDTPGAANSLSRFVSHCRATYGWDVVMPSKGERGAGHATLDRSVHRLRRALATVRSRPVGQLKMLEVVRIISAATGLPMKHLASVRKEAAAAEDESVAVDGDTHIEPGHLLHPYALRWQQLLALRGARVAQPPPSEAG